MAKDVALNRGAAPSLTERMRAAAIRGQTAALEMQEAATEMLELANEVEDFAARQESALVRLRGPTTTALPVVVSSDSEAEEDKEKRSLAKIVGIVGRTPSA